MSIMRLFSPKQKPSASLAFSRKVMVGAFLGLAASLASVPAAQAQKMDEIAAFKDWRVYTSQEKGNKVCFMHSEPVSSSGAEGKKRGAVSIQISHRPADGRYDEIVVNVGYSFKEGAEARVTIGSRAFSMFTQGEHAWNYGTKADRDMVKAIKAGSKLIVNAQSSRGTKTKDTFSLSGTTAAYERLEKECPRK